ncbi:hypothetical protein EBB07_06020 [Paenibacillaceae bacterium]|nr:hypothetical protein EBB07_06020 [Paenibacillaceae bacterium]
MKKFVVGVICGAVVSLGISVSAAEIKNSFVGKKVQSEMTVSVNGKLVSGTAIVIDGASYLPVRAFTNAVGGKVESIKDGRISVVTKDESNTNKPKNGARTKELENAEENVSKKRVERDNLKFEVESLEGGIKYRIDEDKEFMDMEGNLFRYKDTQEYQNDLKSLADKKARIEQLDKEIAELEKELDKLYGFTK